MAKTMVITGTASGLGFATVEQFADNGWNAVATTRDGKNPFPGRANVNVFGLIALTQSFLPTMRARKSGMIINLASISADNGYPYTTVYGSSKAAVLSLTEALNVELTPLGIVAKAILPGSHATEIFTKIDLADDFPTEYQPLFHRFVQAQKSLTGSPAATVADVIWEAVNDGNDDKVRYYAGADATSIPATKRLLGQERYFTTVKKAILNGPGRLGQLLAREGGAR